MTTEGDQKDNWMIVKIKGLEDLLSLAQGSRIAKLRPNIAETLLKKKIHTQKWQGNYFPMKSSELGSQSESTVRNRQKCFWKGGTMCGQQKKSLEGLLGYVVPHCLLWQGGIKQKSLIVLINHVCILQSHGNKNRTPEFLTAMIGYRVSLWRKSLWELQREHMYVSESVNSLSDIQGERTRNQIGGEEDHFKWSQLNPVVDLKKKKKKRILCPKIHISIYFMHSLMVLRVEW